jgi:hypothetical protein
MITARGCLNRASHTTPPSSPHAERAARSPPVSGFVTGRCRWRVPHPDAGRALWRRHHTGGKSRTHRQPADDADGVRSLQSGQESHRRARNLSFVFFMTVGSIVGTFIGGLLLGIVPSGVLLLPLLAVILAVSAVKVWGHAPRSDVNRSVSSLVCAKQPQSGDKAGGVCICEDGGVSAIAGRP